MASPEVQPTRNQPLSVSREVLRCSTEVLRLLLLLLLPQDWQHCEVLSQSRCLRDWQKHGAEVLLPPEVR